ncbi:grpE protein homolog, mitochondrial [Scaptodrosophila lebanonensis]|uniref:GrpE protein homolog n=1 Tax=Drosophila lebanonensis TaxID=7225 RepID=A0A6J2U921_DROLE|nr:grpE protein homolog, mitochondrial [Scaptodrosophila lebanonensis]
MATKASLHMQIFSKHLGQIKAVIKGQPLCLQRSQPTLLARLYSTEKQQQPAVEENNAAATGEQKPVANPEIERLTQELQAAKEQHNELLDKYKRSLADSENMRMRLNKQINDAKIFGIQSFCKDLLEVADTLGHATQAVPKEKLNENADLKNLYEGLTMTRASLLQVFKRHGLEPLDPINQKFDPNLHEALFQKEDKTVEANTVVEVTKLGYKLHERCIRPALVGVSKC